MIYGYARVSTVGQSINGNSLEYQENELKKQGARYIIKESYTGTKKQRPGLNRLFELLEPGDTVIVTKLDRIARNTVDGIQIIDEIMERGCAIRILNMGMFDSTPTGKLMRTVLFAFAEFERDMIVQRTTEGKAIAKRKADYHEGRPTKKSEKFFEIKKAVDKKEMSAAEACRQLGVAKSTWYSWCNQKGA